MKTTILIPHYRTGAVTAHSVKRFLQCRGRHTINIVVIDNSNGIGVDRIPKSPDVTIISYPVDLLQSHGIAFDYALQNHSDLIDECFITAESDSFPIADTWLDHYEDYWNQGWDMAGSRMKLSGGEYVHPAGAMYRKTNWIEARECVDSYGYHFYDSGLSSPSCISLMRKEKIIGEIAEEKLKRYLPVAESVFHQGMAFCDDSLDRYGARSISNQPQAILPRDGVDEYRRIMYEPGQWFSYWHLARGKRIKEVPTEIRWMPGRVNQQQEFSLMENGLKHLWGITAWDGSECEEMQDVIDFKRRQAIDICGV